MQNPFGMGAEPSHTDPRTVSHRSLAIAILATGGNAYSENEIEHQHLVGICTAISVVQRRQKDTGQKYSPDFHYLLQKKLYEKSWYEGSSLFISLKVAKNVGFLPLELFPHITEQDRYLPYPQYVRKLQDIPTEEVNRLMALCVDKIPGYARVTVDADSIAQALHDQPNGILCRYDCGNTWWLPSWLPQDINPLRRPTPATSGHAIIMNFYNYKTDLMQVLSNTWGKDWCAHGTADINFSNYSPTEAWTFLDFVPEIPHYKILRYGMLCPEVKEVQTILGVIRTGYFGPLTLGAVKKFQKQNNLKEDGIVGPETWRLLKLQ